LSGTAWVTALSQLDLPNVRSLVIGEPGSEDLYRNWHRVREIHDAGALLVRPDGYVAWRHTSPVWEVEEALAELRHATDVILARTP